MTSAERKAGKRERIRMLLTNFIKPQPVPVVLDFLNTSLGDPANSAHKRSSYTSDIHEVCCEGDSYLRV